MISVCSLLCPQNHSRWDVERSCVEQGEVMCGTLSTYLRYTRVNWANHVLGMHWAGANLSCIILHNINGKQNYFNAHPFPTFSLIPKRFVIPRNEITYGCFNRYWKSMLFTFINFLFVVLRRCLKTMPLLKCQEVFSHVHNIWKEICSAQNYWVSGLCPSSGFW